MSSRHRQGDGGADGRPRPSDVSTERLARALRCDIADLQVQLEETILRSEAYLAAGLTEEASAVVDEQQDLLHAMHRRLDGHVAAASVEADAESILADSLVRELGEPARDRLVGPVAEDEDDRVTPLRAARSAASVLVGAVAAVALMIMASSPPGPATFAAAGVQDARDPDLDGDGTTGDVADADGVTAPGPAEEAPTDRDRVAGPNDLEVRRLFATTGPSEPAAPDDEDEVGTDLPVFQLQALVSTVVSTVEGVAEAARDGWERALSDRPEGQQAGAEAPTSDESSGPAADEDTDSTGSEDTSTADSPGSSQPTSEPSEETAEAGSSDGEASPSEDGRDGAPADEVEKRLGGTVSGLEQ